MRHRWSKSELHRHYRKILSAASTNARRRSKTQLDSLKLVKVTKATTHFPTLTVYLAIFGTCFATLSINFTISKVYFDIFAVYFSTLVEY